MNELNLGGSIEDLHESIASYSEPMSNEGVIDIQEENKTPAGAEDDNCLMPPQLRL
jgi:stress response protein SCP2